MKRKVIFLSLFIVAIGILQSCEKESDAFNPKNGLTTEDIISFYNMEESVLDNKMAKYHKSIHDDYITYGTSERDIFINAYGYDENFLHLTPSGSTMKEVSTLNQEWPNRVYNQIKSDLERLYPGLVEETTIWWDDYDDSKLVKIEKNGVEITLFFYDKDYVDESCLFQIEEANENSKGNIDIEELRQKIEELTKNKQR